MDFAALRQQMAAASAASAPAALIEFKAGRMLATPVENGAKFRVEADPRKGLLALRKGPDGIVRLEWRLRNASLSNPEDTFEKVDTGREGDRVYLLQYTENRSNRFFFWMQEPEGDKDDERVARLNELMENPDAGTSGTAPGEGRGPAGSVTLDQLTAALGVLGGQSSGSGTGTSSGGDQGGSSSGGGDGGEGGGSGQNEGSGDGDGGDGSQGGSTSATAPPAPAPEQPAASPAPATSTAPTGTGSSGGLTSADFARAMATLSNAMPQQRPTVVPLSSIVTTDRVAPLLDDPKVREALLPLLPETQQTEEELRRVVGSPEVRQTLDRLSSALQSDQFNTILSSLELDPEAGSELLAQGDGIGAFVHALQAAVDRQTRSGSGSGEGGSGGAGSGEADDEEGQ